MRKFSKETNQKIGIEPKKEISKEEIDLLNVRATIHALLDSCLCVKNHGPIRQYTPQNTIDGKDIFIERLINLMSDKSFKDQIKVLESMKGLTQDWLSLDTKIDEIHNTINENVITEDLLPHVEKIKFLLESYNDNFESALTESLNKISEPSIAIKRATAAEKMIKNINYNKYPKDKLKLIAEHYANKYNELVKS